MSDTASLEDDFSIIQIEDTRESSESMLTKSQYAKVIFHDIADAYPTDADICCRYTLTDGVAISPGDRVELFRVGWSQVKESLVHHSIPECTEAGQCDFQVLFHAGELPKDLCDFYQLCYVTAEGGVCGASVPFQFRVPEGTELCAFEEAGDLLVYRTRKSIADEELRQAEDTLRTLSLDAISKDLELKRMLTSPEKSNVEKKAEDTLRTLSLDGISKDWERLKRMPASLEKSNVEKKAEESLMTSKDLGLERLEKNNAEKAKETLMTLCLDKTSKDLELKGVLTSPEKSNAEKKAEEALKNLRLDMTSKELEVERLLTSLEKSNAEKKMLEEKVEGSESLRQADLRTCIREACEMKMQEHLVKVTRLLDPQTSSKEMMGMVENLQLMLEALTQSKELMAKELRVREDTIEQMTKQADAEKTGRIFLTARWKDAEELVLLLKEQSVGLKKTLLEDEVFSTCVPYETTSCGDETVSQLLMKVQAKMKSMAEENKQLLSKKQQLVDETDQLVTDKMELIAKTSRLISEKEEVVEEKKKLVQEVEQLVEEKKAKEALRADQSTVCSEELELVQKEGTVPRQLEELQSQESKLEAVVQDLEKKLESVAPLVKYLLESDLPRISTCPLLKRLVDRVQVEPLWRPVSDFVILANKEADLQLELESMERECGILKEKETIIEQRLQEVDEEEVACNEEIRQLGLSYKIHFDNANHTRKEMEKTQRRHQVPDYEFVDSWGVAASSTIGDLSGQLEEMEVLAESSHLALVELEQWKECITGERTTLEGEMRSTRVALSSFQERILENQAHLADLAVQQDIAHRNHEMSQLLGHCSKGEDNSTKGLEQQVLELKLSLKMAADEYRRIFVEKQKLERRLNKFLAKIEVKKSSGSSSGSSDVATTTCTSDPGVTDKGGPKFGFICPFCSVSFPPGSHDLFTEHFDDHIS